MASVPLIKTCLNIAYYSGFTRILRKPLQGRGSIFCLHHVVPSNLKHSEFSPNTKLEISPEFLENTIKLARSFGYETVSLTQAVESLNSPEGSRKPFVVFTLDDGYRDNFTHAQAIFKKLNCPFTVFVSPGIVEGSVELWWRALEKIIADNISIYVEIDGTTYSYKTETRAEKYASWNTISQALQHAPEYQQREIVREIAKRYKIDLKAMCLEAAMTWDEIDELAKEPLCSIGAHSMGHYAIAKLDSANAAQEIMQSQDVIAEKLGRKVLHFAFPYGDTGSAGQREFDLSMKAGFASSVTTRSGVVFAEHINHLQALPRVMVSGRYAKLRYVQAMMSGVPSFFLNRFKKLNVN